MPKKSTPITLPVPPQSPSDFGIGSLTMNAKQLREALEFANPDGPGDAEQAETEVTVTQRAAFTSSDGDDMPAGLYVHLTEYPEEGVYGPLGIEFPQTA